MPLRVQKSLRLIYRQVLRMKSVKRPTEGGCYEHNVTKFEWALAWDRVEYSYGICICCFKPCEYDKRMRCEQCDF